MTENEIKVKLPDLISRAWSDAKFREKLTADPCGALDDVGITLADGVNVTFHVDSASEKHFVIPAVPDLSGVPEELRRMISEHAAGPCTRSWSGGC